MPIPTNIGMMFAQTKPPHWGRGTALAVEGAFIRTHDIISRGSPFDAETYKYRDDVRTSQASPLGEGDRVGGGRGLFSQRVMFFFDNLIRLFFIDKRAVLL